MLIPTFLLPDFFSNCFLRLSVNFFISISENNFLNASAPVPASKTSAYFKLKLWYSISDKIFNGFNSETSSIALLLASFNAFSSADFPALPVFSASFVLDFVFSVFWDLGFDWSLVIGVWDFSFALYSFSILSNAIIFACSLTLVII